MAAENNTQPNLVKPRSETSTDASTHLAAAQAIADAATVLSAEGGVAELRKGSLCELMCLLERELFAVENILIANKASGLSSSPPIENL